MDFTFSLIIKIKKFLKVSAGKWDCIPTTFQVYFGTQHSRVYLLANWFGENCANGMSWLLKKKALEEEGGLGAFAEYLAEDFFMGKALWLR